MRSNFREGAHPAVSGISPLNLETTKSKTLTRDTFG
jgi:hypothetical protein